MVEVTPDDLITLAPSYAEVDTGVMEFYIDSARDYVNESRWGTAKARRGIILMALHLMARQGVGTDLDGTTGAVISESVGGITTTYAQPVGASSGSTLSFTPYGEQFEQLRRTVVKTPLVT